MKKTILILITIVLVLSLPLSFCGCKKGENTSVNIGVCNTTDSLSLYFAANAKGFFKTITRYVYFADSSEEIYEKLDNEDLRLAVHICYFSVENLEKVFEKENLKIVYIDNFNSENKINGVWVVNTNFQENSPQSYKNFINGIVKATEYRANNLNISYSEAKDNLGNESDVEKANEVNKYLAMYSRDSNVSLIENIYTVKDLQGMQEYFNGFLEGNGKAYSDCQEIYNVFSDNHVCRNFDECFDFQLAIESINNEIE